MIVSTALLVATVTFLAVAALMVREGFAQKLGHSVSTSAPNEGRASGSPRAAHGTLAHTLLQ